MKRTAFRRDKFFSRAHLDENKSHKIHQHTFELNFQVQKLKAALFRPTSDGTERPLGDVTFERFSLAFALAKSDMSVDIDLRFVVPCMISLAALIGSPGLGPSP